MSGAIPEPSGHRDGVFGLAEHEGRILLVRNPRVVRGALRSCWDLPGGTLQPGESVRVALAREWREETGLPCRVGDLLRVVDGAKRVGAGGPLVYTWRAFLHAVDCAGAPRPGAGIEAAAWVERDEAIGRLDAPYHASLRRYLAGDRARYDEVSWIEAAPRAVDACDVPRDLLILAACAAAGDRALLARQAASALASGVSRQRIEETLLQLVPYAGFPRVIGAFGALRPLLGPAPASADEAAHEGRRRRGEQTFASVYGETARTVAQGLVALHPLLASWTLEEAYGRVLGRAGVLTLRERELLAVATLTALGGLDDPLLGHMRAALRLGASREEVAAAVAVVPAALGEGKRAAARALLARL